MLVKSVIKDIQSLALKKHREQKGCYLAEGPKMIDELLRHHRQQIVSIYATQDWVDINRSLCNDLSVVSITESELLRISQWHSPHQVVAVVRQPMYSNPVATDQLTLVCCGLQDPGNLGTIIRTADWFGVRQLVCSPDTVDCFNPKVVQSTMGSIFRMAIHYLDVERWIDQYAEVPVLAATLQGTDVRTLSPYSEAILLIGSESTGIPAALLAKANLSVSIPAKGKAESLNAAVAAGILLSYLS
jgi:RNA methyltransferase, TrmH family